MLFEHKVGFEIASILEYYLGNEEKYIVKKTSTGLLKIVLPHIFAFALLAMVLLHFLIFTKYRDTLQIKVLIYLLFSSTFLEIFSPFAIIFGAESFAYVKLISFFIFQSLIIYVAWLLFHSIVNN
ncbi:hypothetical protein N9X61_02430 [Sulfurimonas sp.]|nr:hypothetical protein [Sulfurimonas sp.]